MNSNDSPIQSQSVTAQAFLRTVLKKIVSFVWHFHRKLFISLILSLALVLLSLHALVYYLEKNPQVIEELVETHFQAQVTFDEIKVGLHPLFPSVSMQNFTIENESGEKNVLEFGSASIRLNIPLSILRGQIIIDTLLLKEFNAIIRRDLNDKISIAEFQLSKAQKGQAISGKKLQSYFSLLNQTNIIISDSEIYFVDEMQKLPAVFFSDINFNMKNNDERHQISLLARLNESDTLVDFRLDFNGRINDTSNWDGKVYAAVDNFNQQTLLHFLKKNVLQVEEFQLNDIKASTKIWSTINNGNLQSIHGELLVEDAGLKRIDNNQSIHFDTMSTNFKLERSSTPDSVSNSEPVSKKSSWLFDLYDLNLSVNSKKISEKFISFKIHPAEKGSLSQVRIFLNKLDLNEFSHVISFFSPTEFNKKVYSFLKPRGRLENVITTFQFDASEMPIDIQHYQVQADINDFGINSVLFLPKVRHFSAQVIFNETRGRATIDSLDMKLYLKSIFRDSWPFEQLSGNLFWQKEGDEWLLSAEKIAIKSPDFTANADLKLWISESGQTLMDLTGFYQNVNVEAIRKYVPAKVMSKGLVKWLDSALISGRVLDGGIAFRGELSEFPYEKHNGNMDIVFNTQDVLLEYLKDWPKLTNINAQVQFTQKGMKIEGQHSKIFSAQSKNIRVDLDDYLERILLIKGDIKSSLDDGLKFLQQSELVSKDVLSTIDAQDEIDINLDLKIPLEKGILDNRIRIELNDADYYPPGFERKKGLVSHLKGDILIHNIAINSKNLSAQIMGLPAQIIIKTKKQSSKSKKDPDVSVHIDSEISFEQLAKFNLIPELLLPLSEQLSGKSNIKVNIDLPNTQRAFAFNIYSSLKNINSNLPAPFKKQAKDSFPFTMSFAEIKPSGKSSSIKNKQTKSALLNMKFSKVLSLVFLIDASAGSEDFKLLKGNLAFAGEKAKLPKDNHLRITGALKHVPFKEWQSVFDTSSKNKNNTPGKRKSKLLLPRKMVSAKTLQAKEIPIPIEIAMTEVVLPEVHFGADDSDKPETTSAVKTGSGLKPEFFPLLNGYINSLKLGKIDLGRFSIKSSRVNKAIIFDDLSLKGTLFSFDGNGKWHHWNAHPRVNLEGKVEIPSLEKMAAALGKDNLVRQGKAQISGDISWPGALNDFSQETIDGKLTFKVDKGAWVEAEPGAAGRLLGLLNMNALVRRLSLDFSDVSKDGFQFDLIEGDFRFNKGQAYTDNLLIYAPSAKILVTGSTDLVTGKIDQVVTVIPEISATLPLAGAAVAGPAGAAVVWLGQKILGDQINRVTAFDYTIKGDWNNPEIKKEKISKNTFNNIKKLFKLEESGTVAPDGNPILDENTSELP